jgi:exosome complex component RRP42
MSMIMRVRQKQIAQLINGGKRLDGREFDEYRELKLENGIIEKAEGSARVLLGETEVLVGIKIGIGDPFTDTPDEGVLTVNAELVPLASPMFDPGPPNEDAIELARVVDRGIREAKTIDLKKLCLDPGKKVLIVFIDLYVLNHDGNLIDASALAALAALMNTKMSKYEIAEGKLTVKPGYDQLPLLNYPIPTTFAKIDNKLIIDPSLEEEEVMDARLTITFEKDEKICAIQKGGTGQFTKEQIIDAVKTAKTKSSEMRKLVVKD